MMLNQEGNGPNVSDIEVPPAVAGKPASDAAAQAPGGQGQSKLDPAPLLAAKRKIDLNTVAMGAMAEPTTVEVLQVRELKGVGATFTPNMAAAMLFRGLVYSPEGEFDAVYQILAGPLLADPRIAGRAKTILFVPAHDWSACEFVLMPIKMSKYGAHVVQLLRTVEAKFPAVKLFVEWSELKRRHVVREIPLTPPERELISNVTWPTREFVLDALSMTAFDNIDELAAANSEIRTLLTAREVE